LEGYTPLEACAAKFADRKISISSFEAEMYRKNHSLESVVIPIGIDLPRFSVPKSSAGHLIRKFAPKNEKIALTVCRLEPRKDLLTLIRAVKYSEKKLSGIKFVIVGDGISRRQIEKDIQSHGLENTILLTGRVSDHELPYYYACADFFILPTKQEWFGIVFAEAMASGLPIITTDVDACPEVAGECGLYFKPGDHAALAEKIMELSGNDALIQNLSKCSLRRAENFDWDKVIKKYEEQYNFHNN
jgi:glycosyltransferase involved in cell wall biosynthesis